MLHEGVYIHHTAMGWVLMTVRVESNHDGKTTMWAGKPEFNSFASARIGALRQATGLDLPYGGECVCVACASIPRNIWSDLKRSVLIV